MAEVSGEALVAEMGRALVTVVSVAGRGWGVVRIVAAGRGLGAVVSVAAVGAAEGAGNVAAVGAAEVAVKGGPAVAGEEMVSCGGVVGWHPSMVQLHICWAHNRRHQCRKYPACKFFLQGVSDSCCS